MSFNKNELFYPKFFCKWDSYKLYDLAIWKNGLAFKKQHLNSIGKPVIKIAELKNGITGQTKFTQNEFDEIYSLKKNDMLFSWSGSPDTSIDIFKYQLEEGWLNQHIFKVMPYDMLTEEYLYYILKYLKPNFIQIAKNKQTTGLGHVTITDMKNIEIRIPKIEEQKAIAKILSDLDNKIEVNNKINQRLEDMAQSIFKHWFIDFEFPNEEGNPYKNSGGEMVESELGMIPKGWEVISLGDVTEIVSKGTTPTTKDMKDASDENNINFLKVKDISDNGLINMNDIQRIPSSIHLGKLKRSILKEKDILFSIAGTIGRITYVNKDILECNINQAIAFIRLNDIDKYFNLLLYSLKTDRVKETLESKVVQGVQQNLSLTVIKDIKLILPTDIYLSKYNNITSNLINEIENINYQNNKLNMLRDTLLPKLMSGEIRVPINKEI